MLQERLEVKSPSRINVVSRGKLAFYSVPKNLLKSPEWPSHLPDVMSESRLTTGNQIFAKCIEKDDALYEVGENFLAYLHEEDRQVLR